MLVAVLFVLMLVAVSIWKPRTNPFTPDAYTRLMARAAEDNLDRRVVEARWDTARNTPDGLG